MTDYQRLPTFASEGVVNFVVEAPRASRAKFKFDPHLGAFRFVRALTLGLRYPFDWGFVPSTLAEDGDPLDGMVIHDAETFPGIVIQCRPIGVLRVCQSEEGSSKRNDRVMFAPLKAPRQKNLDDVAMLSDALKSELERFFVAAVAGTGKELTCEGWHDQRAAMDVLKNAANKFAEG